MSNFLKKNVIGVLCTLATLSASTALCLVAPTHASAETTQPATMAMLAGASARLEDEGLRFIVQMDNATKTEIVNNDSITLELWVMPSAAWEIQKDTTNYADWTKAVVNVDESKIYQLEEATGETNPWYANGVLKGINELGYNKMDMVCAPVKVEIANEVPVYEVETASVAETEMSLYGVLNSAVLDTVNMSADAINQMLTTYTWFGTGDYAIELKDQAAYDSLITNINKGVNLTGKVAINTGKATPTVAVEEEKVAAMPTVETYYTVNFYEADGETLIKSVSVKQGEGISTETLSTIVPATIENKEFDGWGEVTNVTADKNITATYSDVWTVTFYDIDGSTALANRKVKNNSCLTEADLEINVVVDADSRFNGWALTADGEIVSDLTQIPVTESIAYYPILEQKVAVQVTVLVEDYSAMLFGEGDGEEYAARVEYLDNGNNGCDDVFGAYMGDKLYTDKTAEFAKLIANANIKGFVGDTVSLDAFKTSLPDVYSWVADNVGSVTIEDETPSVEIKLDANEEALGFSLLDIYEIYSYGTVASMFKGLTLLEDGTAGVLVTNEGMAKYNSGENLCLRTNPVNVAEYKAINLTFKYKAANHLRIFLNQGAWNSGTYCDPISDWSEEQTVDLKALATNGKNDVDTLRVVRFTTESNIEQPYQVLITGLTYLKNVTISTTENTTLTAEEVYSLAKPLEGYGNVQLTTDENGVQVVRATCEAYGEGAPWYGMGISIALNGITDLEYTSVIVKYKVHNAENFAEQYVYLRIDVGGSAAGTNVMPTSTEIDLMALPIQNVEGDSTDYEGQYATVKSQGLGEVWLRLSSNAANANDFVIDIYSIEFVVNTATAE